MRRRLLIVLSLFAAIAVLAFAVPLALTAATSRTQQLILGRSGDADRFAQIAASPGTAHDPGEIARKVGRYAEIYGEGVLITDARCGTVVAAKIDYVAAPCPAPDADPAPDGDPQPVRDAVTAALRNQRADVVTRLMPWNDAPVLVARPVGTDTQVSGAVVIEASTEPARHDIARIWGYIAATGLAALTLFIGLAITLSRWVLRPLRELSGGVAELTHTLPPARAGDGAAPITRRYGGPPEMRSLARSFDAMSRAVGDAIAAQRRLVDRTAHALRGPLAALLVRLELLDHAVTEDGRKRLASAMTDVERLSELTGSMLRLAQAETPQQLPATCDALVVVRERLDTWHDGFAQARVTLALDEPAADTVEVAVGELTLTEMLDVPLSNACKHAGPGAVARITIRTGSGRVRIDVVDDGIGVPADEIGRLTEPGFRTADAIADDIDGFGLGTPILAALVGAHNGTLTISAVEPHGLAVAIELPAGRQR